jgi:tetratricopeptide (TPR) repeat protein
LGGAGKTQLALQYTLHTHHQYTMKIWFSGSDMSKLKQRYEDLALEFGYNKEKHSHVSAISYVKKWLAQHPGWLMVMNNVDNYQDIEQFLPDKGGHIILTTRNRDWPSNFKILSVGVMTEVEAVDTLNILVKDHPNDELERKKELAARLGYLPLALSQAGSYIYQKNQSVAEYIELYNKNELKLLSDISSQNGVDTMPVFVVWDISLHAIIKEMLEENEPPIAMELIIVCSYLAPEKISRDLLLSWIKHAHPNLSNPEITLNKHIKLLWKYSMINYENDKNTISIHKLVQTVLRHQLARSIENKHGMFPNLSLKWYNSLLCFFIMNESDFKIRNSFSQLLETREQFLSLFKGEYNDKLALLDLVIGPVYYYQERFEDYSKLLNKVSSYLLTKPNREYLKAKVLYLESASARKKGDFKLAEQNLKDASEIFKKVKVDDHFNAKAIAKLKGQILFNKANLVYVVNESLSLANRDLKALKEAIILTREATSIFTKTKDIRNKLKSIELRGRIYILLNEHKQAIDEFDEYQDILKTLPDNRLTMSYYNTYSDAYFELGNFSKALEYANMTKDLAIKLELKIQLQDSNINIEKISDMMRRGL